MSHGRPGDNPITDILFHNSSDYSPEIRNLFKEVYELSSKRFNVFNDLDLYTDTSQIIHEKLIELKKKLCQE